MKVVFACPTITRPYQQFLDAMRDEVPFLDAAEIDHGMTFEMGSAYISHARASMLRKALDVQPDAIVFLDHDLSWKSGDLLKLLQTPGHVVCGTYRFKSEPEKYMGTLKIDDLGKPVQRDDGCVQGDWVPAGFLKVSAWAIDRFMEEYPELVYGPRYRPSVDLFNHGAHKGVWYGEDYAFSRRWNDLGGEIWVVPDLDITHHGPDGTPYPGNLHQALLVKPDLAEAA